MHIAQAGNIAGQHTTRVNCVSQCLTESSNLTSQLLPTNETRSVDI